MKIVNVILAVMILGLVGTSIYFAHTLHAKRYVMKVRADKMRDTIQQFAGNVDQLLEIKDGAEITKEKLHHTQRASALRTTLANLMKQQEAFARYQETTVAKLAEAAQTLGVSQIFSSENAISESLIGKVKANLGDGARKLVERDDALVAGLMRIAGEYEIPVTQETLANLMDMAPATTACVAVGEKIDQTWSRMESYENTIRRVARLGSAKAPDFSGDYPSGIADIQQKMGEIDPKIAELEQHITDANGNIKNLNGEIKTADAKIVELNTEVADREKTKADLMNILTLPAPNPHPWTDRTIALQALRGTVTAVNKDWNFMVVNCGTEAKVKQPGTDHLVAAPVPQAGKRYRMVVAQAGNGNPIYTGQVTIAKTDTDYCVVNIDLALENSSRPIAVGDVVIFTDEEISAIVKETSAPSAPESGEEPGVQEDTAAVSSDAAGQNDIFEE